MPIAARAARWGLVGAGAALLALLSAMVIGSRLIEPPRIDSRTSVLALDRRGDLLRALTVENGRWRLPVHPTEVDPLMIDLLLMWEDGRFEHHAGVDWAAILRAGLQLVRHRRILSGGSTLSMQLARLLGQDSTRSPVGKWRQLLTALALERTHDKAAILQAYLQRAGYGGNLEGVRSASLAYFGKEPRRLALAEAALLVALPQSPERRRPDRYPKVATESRNRVLERAARLGVVSPAAAAEAMSAPVPRSRQELPRLAAHRVERLARAAQAPSLMRLTIDASLQRRLEELAARRGNALPPGCSVAILVADHQTGEVLASVGSAGYADLRGDGYVDMTEARRSPGSTLKPLIYGLAFELGIAHPESLIEDRPSGFGTYAPSNFDGDFAGTVTVREALQRSLNVPAVTLLDRVGPARLLARLRRAGAQPELPGHQPAGLAIALGGLGLSLRELVGVYGAIARGGEPLVLRERLGLEIRADATAPQPVQPPVVDRRAAWYLSAVLSGADAFGLGAGEIALKTGTSFGYRDAWAIGYDARHVIGVWTGRPDGAPVEGLTGASAAVPILNDAFMRIGARGPWPDAPPGVIMASTGELGPSLRRVDDSPGSRRHKTAVQIAYPPSGARIDLGLRKGRGREPALVLKVRGGEAPFTWVVNGERIAREGFSRTARWPPDGAGFAEILLIDASGSSARSIVFID